MPSRVHLPPLNWRDEDEVSRAFNWLTRAGVGVTFGGRPIGWYQIHQCHAIDVLVEHLGGPGEFRFLRGAIEGRRHGEAAWRVLPSVRDLFEEVDRRARDLPKKTTKGVTTT